MKIYWINCGLLILATWFITTQTNYGGESALGTLGVLLGTGLVLWLLSYTYDRSFFRKIPKIFSLFFYFMKEVVRSGLRVAVDIVRPHFSLSPAVIAFPLTASSDWEITTLANMISLTPGTLSLAVSDDRKILYVHGLYIKDVEKEKETIKEGFERKILNITRG